MNHPSTCKCFDQYGKKHPSEVLLHSEQQDTAGAGWRHLLELIDQAAADGRTEFAPIRELPAEEQSQIVTLPGTIAKLTAVRELVLYGSHLVRIPPEIGKMTSLEVFTPYTSHRLHWFPYEITRCKKLKKSTVSTRALYGNEKFQPPFPKLPVPASLSCSVCDGPITEAGRRQKWISRLVATDVLPLLVNACSEVCIEHLPA